MVSSVWPVLHYDDTAAARQFLVDVVGFDEALVIRDDDGDIVHAELTWPGGGAINFGGTRHDSGVHAAMRSGTSAVYLATEDVDAVVRRVRGSSVGTIIQPPAATQFGAGAIDTYAATIADAEGNLWTLGTYPGAAR